ncbi:MAG: hypothetical protein PHZ09_10405 [Eubacteriales bacterium]|jgi:hypothetical protein|nr:hypothetical protein [Eubacteriales bacterium]
MKGVIIKRSGIILPSINRIFDAIHNVQIEYNWLITDIDVISLNQGYNVLSKVDYVWISGEELIHMTDDFQWCFAVFSGFPKDVSKEQVLTQKLPYADGYPGFWQNPVGIQHPMAEVEIVPFDAAYYLVISKIDKIAEDLKIVFPTAEDIETYNNRIGEHRVCF